MTESYDVKKGIAKMYSTMGRTCQRHAEAIEWGKETGTDSGSIGFYNHMLKRLQNELKSE